MPKISERLDCRGPLKGDRLLRQRGNSGNGITFSDHSVSRHAHIWIGYMRAGSALIDDALGKEFSERHFLIYPALFCYRHALEMAMKWIVSQYGRYAVAALPKLDHDLWQLWQSCRNLILAITGEDGSGTMAIVEKCVKELHDLDKAEQAFHYPMSKTGLLIRLPDIPIDLLSLREVMERLDWYFSGIDCQLDALTSAVDR
jgi:hypothetical protein